jgi:hypothetical protein
METKTYKNKQKQKQKTKRKAWLATGKENKKGYPSPLPDNYHSRKDE